MYISRCICGIHNFYSESVSDFWVNGEGEHDFSITRIRRHTKLRSEAFNADGSTIEIGSIVSAKHQNEFFVAHFYI